jgi:hypothetical protein
MNMGYLSTFEYLQFLSSVFYDFYLKRSSKTLIRFVPRYFILGTDAIVNGVVFVVYL